MKTRRGRRKDEWQAMSGGKKLWEMEIREEAVKVVGSFRNSSALAYLGAKCVPRVPYLCQYMDRGKKSIIFL